MEMSYVNKGLYNFLDVNIGERDEVIRKGLMYKIKMLEMNNIDGIISPYENEVDGNIFLRYNTDSSYVLDKMMQKMKPDKKLLKNIINQISLCVKSMEVYLLNPNDLIIDPFYMFFDSKEEQLKLICVPGYNKDLIYQIKDFLEYVMKIFNHRDQSGVLYLYELYDRVANREYIFAAEEKTEDSAVKNRMPSEDIRVEEPAQILFEKEEKSEVEVKKYIPIIMAVVFAVGALCKYAFGGNDIFWLWLCVGCFAFASVNIVSEYAKEQQEQEIDVSMIKYTEEKNISTIKNSYRLVPLNNGAVEPIEINNVEVKIGRSKEDADYRLKKSQISRVHARVFVESGKLYVVDEDSTNGTFVNNVRVMAHELNNIKVGDVVAFATEEYFVA